MEFKDNLRRIRMSRNMTQVDVADYLGLHRASYAYWEIGKSEPSIRNIKKLAELFDVSYDELFK